MATTKKPKPAATGSHRGTGHPNELLFVDYAFSPARRSFKVETDIDLTKDVPTFNALQKLLETKKPWDLATRRQIVALAHGKVKSLGGDVKDRNNAKKMFAAAFDVAERKKTAKKKR